jgi:hypothetical protein
LNKSKFCTPTLFQRVESGELDEACEDITLGMTLEGGESKIEIGVELLGVIEDGGKVIFGRE